MKNEKIVYFQALDMGWVINEHFLNHIDPENFSLRHLGEVSINTEGRPGTDSGPNTGRGAP